MNRKPYLRGIGAGMIVTAIIMGIASGSNRMSDAEILRRAAEIQESESVTLLEHDKNNSVSVSAEAESQTADNEADKENALPETESNTSIINDNNEENDSSAETVAPPVEEKNDNSDETNSSEANTDNNESNDNKEDGVSDKDASDKDDKPASVVSEPEKINPMPEGETGFVNNSGTVEISVIRGDSSVSVSRRMFEAGLVESAAEFDKFLCVNGYDKRISVGTYEIAYGLEFEDMAKIITKSR